MRVSKRPRLDSKGEGRLANLHDSVVNHIVSHLPTRDAIRTSVLSKDWRNKWISSYSIDIDDTNWYNQKTEPFVNLMNRLLSTPCLRIFRLTVRQFANSSVLQPWNSSCLQSWISDALHQNLECFEVSTVSRVLVVPCRLLNSASLRKSKLEVGTLCVAAKNCAPNLTTLYLNCVNIFSNSPDSSTVSFDFPVLKTLTIRQSCCENVKSLQIRAPSLTKFTSHSHPLNQFYRKKDNYYSIIVVAPKLITFSGSLGLPEVFILNGSSVSEVLLIHGETRDPQQRETVGVLTRNNLDDFPGLEKLELSSFNAEVMLLGTLRHLDKLSRLTLRDPSSPEQLLHLLRAMPSLRFLSFNMGSWKDYDYGAIELMPSCVVSHLEEVVLQEFDGEVPQYNLAKFLLKTAEQLKKFTFTNYYVGLDEQIKKVLSTFDRYSTSLTIDSY